MRSSIFSALVVASLMSATWGAPTAAPSSSAAAAAIESTSASMDSRIEQWARMRIALPDGLFPEDKVAFEQEQAGIVPMIVMDEASFSKPVSFAKPIDRHQRTNEEKGYKHLSIASFDPVHVVPLSPELQQDMNEKKEADDSQTEQTVPSGVTTRRYRKFIGLSDSGEAQMLEVPTVDTTTYIQNEQELEGEQQVQAKHVVGLDQHGHMRFVDIPYYNRASRPQE